MHFHDALYVHARYLIANSTRWQKGWEIQIPKFVMQTK